MSEMTPWDFITLSVALVIIVVYIVVRIRRTLSNRSCSCGLKPSGCSTESAERCSGSSVSTISTKDIGVKKGGDDD